ncbi:replication-relaxation family protein [Ktedonospora formicarum]|uniref:HTH arsR-type domain-containing protein n=1 Tax=Ktedonospora formicarum TaxID=2778364 RepID=A0A8J3MY16_9CHLR|nr:replication-relaxation family protein [Ktedonospora formicarum]GHO49190.1 hypothetical protein KSX_73530 [Ktedonospora formicarum]
MHPQTNEPVPSLIADLENDLSMNERILLWLLKQPLQRIGDLAFTLKRHASSISRHLDVLERQGLVEPIRVCLTEATLYYLTTAGIGIVADILGADPVKLAQVWKAGERHLLGQLSRLSPLLRLRDVVHGFVAHTPTRLAHSGGHTATLRWHQVQEYTHSFLFKGKPERCRVDAILAMVRPALHGDNTQDEALFSVLWMLDPGLVGRGDLRLIQQRLEALLKFRESAERWPWYSHFPPLLILTRDTRSRTLWQRRAKAASERLRVAPLVGAIANLASDTVSSRSNPWLLPWQHLATERPCHLEEILHPMPTQATLPHVLAPKMMPPGIFALSQKKSKQPKLMKETLSTHILLNGKDKRENIALLGLQLSQRHLECLLRLYEHPLLSRDELATFTRLQPDTVTRYLYDLRKHACIERYDTPHAKRYALSERGGRFIAMYLQLSLLHVFESSASGAYVQRGVPHLLRRIAHTAGIYSFLARMQEGAEREGHVLEWWETEERSARRYRMQGQWHNFLPDATFCYAAGAKRFCSWLEWDEGTMHARDLTTKFSSYAHYLETQTWMREYATLPILLVVVPHPGQEQRMSHVVRNALEDTSLVVRVTTTTRLDEKGPLAEIWHQILPPTKNQQRGLLDVSH